MYSNVIECLWMCLNIEKIVAGKMFVDVFKHVEVFSDFGFVFFWFWDVQKYLFTCLNI